MRQALALVFIIASAAAQVSGPLSIHIGPILCGPPAFACASNSTAVVQLPSPLPNMGDPLHGVNTHWTDSVFPHATYTRVTDADDSPNAGTYTSFGVGDSGNPGWINADDTMFITSTTGGDYVIKTWDGVNSGRTNFHFPDTPVFDPVVSTRLWERDGLQMYVDTLSGGNIAKSLAIDFGTNAHCLPGYGKVTWHGELKTSRDGDAIASAYSNGGGQETGTIVAVYFPGKGCRVLNTQTGIVTGDFGPTGKVVGTLLRFTLHDAGQTPNPNFVTLSSNHCYTPTGMEGCVLHLVWESTTLNLRECGTWPISKPYCGGHHALGFNKFAVSVNNFSERAYDAPNTVIGSLTPIKVQHDFHGMWPQTPAQVDTMPAFMATTWVGRPAGPNTYPFENEIVGFDGHTAFREGFTWATGHSQLFACANAIATQSWDGKWFFVQTDGQGKFGSTSGQATCTIGVDCRCDVVVIQAK